MTNRKITIVNREAMMTNALFADASSIDEKSARFRAHKKAIQQACEAREAFEATRERRTSSGVVVGQSADIKHVQALATSDAFARVTFALKMDVMNYIHPFSKGSKSDTETSNLKAYRKALQICETILTGASNLENVVKVATVCMYLAATRRGAVIERDFAETFLSSVEFRTVEQASEELWKDIDAIRAKHMLTGAPTQTSQMIRTLVAFGAARDVRDGRNKHVELFADHPVVTALMTRFGVIDAQQA